MEHSGHHSAGKGKVRDRPNTLAAVITSFLVATMAAVVVFRLWPGDGETFPLWLALTCAVLPYLGVFMPLVFRAMKRRRRERKPRDA